MNPSFNDALEAETTHLVIDFNYRAFSKIYYKYNAFLVKE